MIARGLAADARLFVLDEPTASLTDAEIEHLHRVLRTLRDEGVAIVYVSHRLDEIFAMTDRVTVMRDGGDGLPRQDRGARQGATDRADHRLACRGREADPARDPGRRRGAAAGRGLTVPGIVENVSFALRAGEMLGIAGLVGAGRTELMRAIFGADRAASGEI